MALCAQSSLIISAQSQPIASCKVTGAWPGIPTRSNTIDLYRTLKAVWIWPWISRASLFLSEPACSKISKRPCRTIPSMTCRLLVWCCCWHLVDQKMAHGAGQIKASILSMVRRRWRYTDNWIQLTIFTCGCDMLRHVRTFVVTCWDLWVLVSFGCFRMRHVLGGCREVDSWTCATTRWTDMSKQVGNAVVSHVTCWSWVMTGHSVFFFNTRLYRFSIFFSTCFSWFL